MRTSMLTVATLLLGLMTSSVRAADTSNPSRDEFERRARQINRSADKEATFKKGLHYVSVETGVPESRIEAQHRQNPDIGLAGILIANTLAAETKKNPSTFIREHNAGKGWVAIAKENNVSLDNLNKRLDNLENALGSADQKSSTDSSTSTSPSDRRRRDRADANRDEIERRTQKINRETTKQAVLADALHSISLETGVPQNTVENQHQRNSDLGLGDLMVANVLAAETKKDSDYFIQQYKQNKNWMAIARDNNVPVDNVTRKLDNLEKAVAPAVQKAREDATSEDRQIPQRERQR